jgi:hypothetical protein
VSDLYDGRKAEEFIGHLLNEAGLHTVPVDSKGPNRQFWDLETTGQLDFKTEVKYDKMEERTGNIAIEIWNPKSCKPSGLTITKSDFWCHVLSDAAWIVPTQQLREYLDNNVAFKFIGQGGDSNASFSLYKSHIILPAIFTRIDHLEASELKEKINELWQSIK